MTETPYDPAADGWHYRRDGVPEGGDARKLVTLEHDGMRWIGIRAFNHKHRHWMNNNEPELATVKAWRDLPAIAEGFWNHGIFYLLQQPEAR